MKYKPYVRFQIDCPYPASEAYYRLLAVTQTRVSLLRQFFNSFRCDRTPRRPYLGYVNRKEFQLRSNGLSEKGLSQARLPIISGRIEQRGRGCFVDITIRPRWVLTVAFATAVLLLALYVGFMRPAIFHLDLVYLSILGGFIVGIVLKHCSDVVREREFLVSLLRDADCERSETPARGLEMSAR